MELPVYKLEIKDNDESGVLDIALVDMPAIESNWKAFSKEQQFKTKDKDKRIVMGAAMIPDMKIYRNDGGREYEVYFDAETIEKIRDKYFKAGHDSHANLMHDEDTQTKDVYVIESFISDSKRGVKAPEGFEGLPEGTWFVSMKVDNDTIWNNFVKTGKLKGFSVEGFFNEVQEFSAEMEALEFLKGLE